MAQGTLNYSPVRMASNATTTAINGSECTPFVSQDTYEWCKRNKVPLKDGSHAKVGDVVLCSHEGKDFTNPCDLGVVMKVGRQKLVGKNGQPHPDGEYGDLYVLTFKKQKVGGRYKLECTYIPQKRIM